MSCCPRFYRARTCSYVRQHWVGYLVSVWAQCRRGLNRDLSSLVVVMQTLNHNLYIYVDDTCTSMFSYAHRIKVVWKGRKTNKVDATTPTDLLVKSSSRAE